MKQTALKLLQLVYRTQKLPVKGIDDEITIPVSESRALSICQWNDASGWVMHEHYDDSIRSILEIGTHGNIYDDEMDGYNAYEYADDDEIWPAIIKWCVDRLY